jgi:hypothetical protein
MLVGDEMNEIALNEVEQRTFKEIMDDLSGYIKSADGKKLSLGVLEMAAGAGILAYGVHSGLICFGTDIVGTSVSSWNIESIVGGGLGGGLGATAGMILGGIGVAGAGSAIGIPAAMVAGGAAAVLAAFGYVGGDLLTHV